MKYVSISWKKDGWITVSMDSKKMIRGFFVTFVFVGGGVKTKVVFVLGRTSRRRWLRATTTEAGSIEVTKWGREMTITGGLSKEIGVGTDS